MHILVRHSRSLDDDQAAVDLDQKTADMVLLSFSDSDLLAVAEARQSARDDLPSLRLANLAQLRHPLSVDLYVERMIVPARAVVVRLLGGIEYWRYGIEQVAAACRQHDVPLAILPGDGRDDARLAALSTVSEPIQARLHGYFHHGGPDNLALALRLMAFLTGRGPREERDAEPLSMHGVFAAASRAHADRPLAVLVFYRAHLMAGDTAPIYALADALERVHLGVLALFVSSLKDPACARWVADTLRQASPRVVVNATGFSARTDQDVSPLDAADVPVLQVVLSGSMREAWQQSSRGLSQTDLAMQVVLPELDGRVLAGVVSFKQETAGHPDLQFRALTHVPDDGGVRLAAARAAGWARLATMAPSQRRVAIVLSDYPNAPGQIAHAVGLDAPESTAVILRLLSEAGYDTGATLPTGRHLVDALRSATRHAALSLEDYRGLLAELPTETQGTIAAAWGTPESDVSCVGSMFRLPVLSFGRIIVAIQPDRGDGRDRKGAYHNPDVPPCHGYVAFYLWLRRHAAVDAIVHLGTHGTLEWLPGKAVALSDACHPAALIDGVPVIYPFIVNNPGEAAQAKRRVGAVTIGHLTPPLSTAGVHGSAKELEQLIDEYAAADGLDRRRTGLLRREILDRAEDVGLLAESGASRAMPEEDALARLDAFLCDVKDMQIRDGLHVFGEAMPAERRGAMVNALAGENAAAMLDASPVAERRALLDALDGRFVPPGPAGAPTRGRADVLPTGRNLYSVDPRALPTRSALVLARRAADELLRRHLQEQGAWPRSVMIDLWGSTAMRTGGEDLALAFILMGVNPVWDSGSGRVSGIDVVPAPMMDRPRIDVTLRISGLFRDAFPQLIALFDQAVRLVARLPETPAFNPLAAAAGGLEGAAFRQATTRIYGAPAGTYGSSLTALLDTGLWQERAQLGTAHLLASSGTFGLDLDGAADSAGLSYRLATVDVLVHTQDHAEIDLLEGSEAAAHHGGLAAAAEGLGAAPAHYHLDTSRPDSPRARALAEEIVRVTRGRLANPRWLAGMMRHGYRGAADIARSVDGLFACAATLSARFDRQFDVVYDATLGDPDVDAFLQANNPDARVGMQRRFAEALHRGLWRPRRNAVAADLPPWQP